VIFGTVQGTAMVSVSATMAATASFLIARYFARDKVKAIADKNPKFAAIDRAIGQGGRPCLRPRSGAFIMMRRGGIAFITGGRKWCAGGFEH
jgi:hypothetical protein